MDTDEGSRMDGKDGSGAETFVSTSVLPASSPDEDVVNVAIATVRERF